MQPSILIFSNYYFLNQVISKGREIGPAGVEISLHVTSGNRGFFLMELHMYYSRFHKVSLWSTGLNFNRVNCSVILST